MRQSLRDAIAENKTQTAEIAKLKAVPEAVEAERDMLSQKLDRVEADKQRAVKTTKARYLAELRKLRDAHKEEKDKAVDDAEDRGYAQGEKTYERQVQAYANAAQNRLIEEAKKAAEEEAAAAQQTEQTSLEASQDVEDQVADREVVAVEGADDEAVDGLPEQTVEVAEQTVDLELD
ncbi:hypothetical protein CsSME_00023086 [Camellia sinensis var. sinensis]